MRLNLKLLRLNGNQREDIFKKGGGGGQYELLQKILCDILEKIYQNYLDKCTFAVL